MFSNINLTAIIETWMQVILYLKGFSMKRIFLIATIISINASLMAQSSDKKNSNDANDKRVHCYVDAVKVIDKFIDQYRGSLGKCDTKSECVWALGGSGVHVNRIHYNDLFSCFYYANSKADKFCRFGPKGPGNNFGGFANEWDPGKRPEEYACVDHLCTPIYSKNRFSDPIYKWSASALLRNIDKSDAIDKCKADVDKAIPNELEKLDY